MEREVVLAWEVSCKLAEFLVSSTAKYCLALYVSRMLPPWPSRKQLRRRGTTMSPGLSCFAHWYSRYFQLTGAGVSTGAQFRRIFPIAFFPSSSTPSRPPFRPSFLLCARVLFVVHKVYSPRDRRSFFCDSTSDSREVVAGGTAKSRGFFFAFSGHRRRADRKQSGYFPSWIKKLTVARGSTGAKLLFDTAIILPHLLYNRLASFLKSIYFATFL